MFISQHCKPEAYTESLASLVMPRRWKFRTLHLCAFPQWFVRSEIATQASDKLSNNKSYGLMEVMYSLLDIENMVTREAAETPAADSMELQGNHARIHPYPFPDRHFLSLGSVIVG